MHLTWFFNKLIRLFSLPSSDFFFVPLFILKSKFGLIIILLHFVPLISIQKFKLRRLNNHREISSVIAFLKKMSQYKN
jgi:hypothetical protein